jgi:hypothetical protein
MSIDNSASPLTTDDVRASRDGHTYHETWAARIALELLYPSTDLVAITMEGFSIEDEPSMSDSAMEMLTSCGTEALQASILLYRSRYSSSSIRWLAPMLV